MTESGWKYAAASVIGTSHQSCPEGVCQDSHAFRYMERASAFVGVVSDGAGSASRSQKGSRCACDYVLEKIATAPPSLLFEEDFVGEVLEGLRQELQALADNAELRIREFACTLLVAIVCPDRVVFWQIGDGAMCFRERDEERYSYAFWPEKGDYANVTYFVTDANAKENLYFDIAETEIVELGMFSDGSSGWRSTSWRAKPITAFSMDYFHICAASRKANRKSFRPISRISWVRSG